MASFHSFRYFLLVITLYLADTVCAEKNSFINNPNAPVALAVLGVVLFIFALTFGVITCYICYQTRPRKDKWLLGNGKEQHGRMKPRRRRNERYDHYDEDEEEGLPWSYRNGFDAGTWWGPSSSYNMQNLKPTDKDKVFVIN